MNHRPVDDVTRPRLQGDEAQGGGYVQLMPSDFALKTMNAVHRGLLKLTCGRAGYHVSNMPVLELTTIGRKSGQPRSVMLTSPVQDGTTLVVVASRGGDDTNPAWFLNLRDNPEVDVALQGAPKKAMLARVATADERSALWPRVIADHKNYAGYQTKTSREIPLVLLEPKP
jgi:deazaflavin-dependent oxidoreductase (nitroreductase family)